MTLRKDGAIERAMSFFLIAVDPRKHMAKNKRLATLFVLVTLGLSAAWFLLGSLLQPAIEAWVVRNVPLVVISILLFISLGYGVFSYLSEAEVRGQLLILRESKVLSQVQPNHSKKERFDRFEDIHAGDRKIRYGFVPFDPTISCAPGHTTEAVGFGIDLLGEVFGGKIEPHNRVLNWNNVLDGLDQRLYDVIATPLYDIRERRDNVLFTSPLFYADIGAYTSRDNEIFSEIISRNPNGVEFKELKSYINQNMKTSDGEVKLVIRGISGELQMKLAEKHFFEARREEVANDYVTSSFVEALTQKNSDCYSDIFFCERPQAERMPQVKSKRVVQLLKPGTLLFPVAFAVSKNEDTLRKYINLRLLDIDARAGGGELTTSGIGKILIDSVRKLYDSISDKDIAQYYTRSFEIEEKSADTGEAKIFDISSGKQV